MLAEEARFWAKVNKTPGCWVWTAGKRAGYGKAWFKGKTECAHRVSYRLLVGDIPEGKELDHICRNRACVNPSHLEAVVHRINSQRGEYALRPTCPYGHPKTGNNVRIRTDGKRICRPCEIARCKAWRIKNSNYLSPSRRRGDDGKFAEPGRIKKYKKRKSKPRASQRTRAKRRTK